MRKALGRAREARRQWAERAAVGRAGLALERGVEDPLHAGHVEELEREGAGARIA